MQKLALVTGAGGFIGHHLVKHLQRQGFRVRGVDIKLPDFEPSTANEFLQVDLREKANCVAACRGASWVFHLAADMGGIGFISEFHAEVCRNNSLMNIHMLDAAREAKVRRFLFSSTACIYPIWMQKNPDIKPLKESDAFPADPEEGYGWEKIYMEKLCEYYRKDYGLDTRIARFHNVYGPLGTFTGGREKAPAAVCFKIAQAAAGDSIDVWGDGQQTRSFMFVDDCVEGVLRIMKSDVVDAINLGTEELVTIDHLYDMVSSIADKQVVKRHDLTKPQGVRGRNSDNTMIRNLLGWEPKTPLADGLVHTYRWIHGLVSRPDYLAEILSKAASDVKSAGKAVVSMARPSECAAQPDSAISARAERR
jgi:GDP-D-mannose 3',5'-epimerase